jgi:putative hemolysin
MKYIDLAQSIRSSNSVFLKKLPDFIIRLMEKIIRQEAMNGILDRTKDCKGAEFQRKVIVEEFGIDLSVDGLGNLPDQPRCIFVANHPFGMIDGLILTMIVLEKYGDLRVLGNDALELVPNLRPYLTSVNVYSKNSRATVMEIDEVFKSALPITHFPAGEVSRRYKGKIQDCDWQKSFINKAVSTQRDIVPFFFHGRNTRLFYAIHRLRNILGIRLNMELLLLPHEMFKKKHKKVRVTIGKPIPWQKFDNSRSAREWAEEVKQQVYGLAGNNGVHQ